MKQVMTLLVACCLIALAAPSWAVEMRGVEVRSRINDHALIISNSERHRLYQLLAQHERASKRRLVVVTAESHGEQNAEVAAEITWLGWGFERKERGAMLLLFKQEKRAVIHAGKEAKQLTAAAINTILNGAMRDPLSSGDFDKAVGIAVEAIITRLGN